MSAHNHPTGADAKHALALAELIRLEIDGKKIALGRYDEILWKIRSGYIVILYGALGLALKDFSLTRTQLLFLIVGFSFLGCIVDYTFSAQKLRVIKAINLLVDQAVSIATEKGYDVKMIQNLLHISGQLGELKVTFNAWFKDSWSIILLYCFTPILFAVLPVHPH